MSLMTAGSVAWRRGSALPGIGFWDAIDATTPEVWLRLNEAGGATAVNSGTGSDGTYSGSIAYSQGSLCSSQAGADSIRTSSSGAHVRCGMTLNNDFVGVIGLCHAGSGAGSGAGAVVLWRTNFSNIGASYIRTDQSNIIVQPSPAAGALSTGVSSSVLKDGHPHFVMVGRLAGDAANLRMWIDGSLVWTHALGSDVMIIGADLLVARNGNTTQYAYGRYADAFVSAGVSSSQAAAINAAWTP